MTDRMYPGPTGFVEFRVGAWVLAGEWSSKPYHDVLPDTLSGVRNMLAAMEADPSEQPQDGREGFGRWIATAPPPWHPIEQSPAGVGELLLFIPDLGWRPAEYDGAGNWRSPIDDMTYTDGTHWMYCLPRPDET